MAAISSRTKRHGLCGLRVAVGAFLATVVFAAPGKVLAGASPVPAHAGAMVHDLSAKERPRQRPRVRIYRRAYTGPGPNSVRECSATYVQEHRPSGTVIVPRMHCWWTRG